MRRTIGIGLILFCLNCQNYTMAPVVWMTGLSGSGKTTISRSIKRVISNTVIIDGDDIRNGVCSDLGFDLDSRKENIRRISHIAKVISNNGILSIVPVICPTNEMRELAKSIIGSNFILTYIKSSIEICEARDVKGLYAKVRAGEISNFTGIDSPFEDPADFADITVDTGKMSVSESVGIIVERLMKSWPY